MKNRFFGVVVISSMLLVFTHIFALNLITPPHQLFSIELSEFGLNLSVGLVIWFSALIGYIVGLLNRRL